MHFREENIFNFGKQFKKNTVLRNFNKELSVFSRWKLDNNHIIKNCIDHDFRWWKLKKFIKYKTETDMRQIDDLKQTVIKYFEPLKATHISLASRSHFPSVSIFDWTNFAKRANLPDKNL